MTSAKGANQRGTVTIETALGMFFFLLVIFYWCEISYMGFVSASLDYAVAEASRSARTKPAKDYQVNFKEILKGSSQLWSSIIDTNKLSVSIHYYDSVLDLASEYCPEKGQQFCKEKAKPKDASIAIYRVTYLYKPIFTSLFINNARMPVISREVISIQEYERSSFNG
ncbi:TadE/TadG family type IV pilus assembly protein [Parendozoicomonas sp. Alg238-R29]|uniref:TadE/TadG family type IV pilus assembly protein n=1 Tax=Parendozoicomonas sp. Alg238-R29 TaxID=2993446 RepID=UPI00248EF98A|nr:TadE/TadG family type IV pilus assembly protein [Parendozoicomonas sp. Alg238-R29]